MARYAYACPIHGEFDLFFPMGQAPEQTEHPFEDGVGLCLRLSKRVYSFNFQEDRRRLRKGTSPATGKPYAQSRSEERMIEQATGVHFSSRADLLPHERQAIAYADHVASGGEPVANAVTLPQEKLPPLTDYMRDMGYKRREYNRPALSMPEQDRQMKEIIAKHG